MQNQGDQNTLRQQSQCTPQHQNEHQNAGAPHRNPAAHITELRPAKTEACLLYRRRLMQDDPRLQSLLERHGLTALNSTKQPLGPDAPVEQHFESATHRLTFIFSATPRPASDFQDALRSPYLGAYRGMISSMIERHESYMSLRLTSRDPAPQSTEAYTDQLRLLHALTRAIARATSPIALYWSASSQILTGAQYSALIRVDAPWALFVHPIPQAAGTDREGRALTALHLEGAAHFLGQEVSLAPTALPRADILRLGLGFIQYCAERDTMIAPGESLGKDRHARVERGPATDRIDLIARVPFRDLPPAPIAATFAPPPQRWRSAFITGGVVAASLALVAGTTLTATSMHASANNLASSEITTTVLPPQR